MRRDEVIVCLLAFTAAGLIALFMIELRLKPLLLAPGVAAAGFPLFVRIANGKRISKEQIMGYRAISVASVVGIAVISLLHL